MKFGQLIEYNLRNIFLEKSYKECGGEASPRPFYKKNQNWAYVQVKIYQNILKLRSWALAFTLYKTFLKIKNESRTSLRTSFSAWFLKKNISHAIFY